MFLKFIKYLFYTFLTYVFLGFFLLPFLLKPQLIKIIEQKTTAKVKIESFSFNPLIFQLEINGFSLENIDKKELFDLKMLRINLNPSSLLIGAIELKELTLIEPRINIIYNKDKSINLLKIIKKEKGVKESSQEGSIMSSLPRIMIDLIDIEGGEVSYRDYTLKTPFSFGLENIGFSFKDFDTQNIASKRAQIRFYARLSDGGFVDLKSKLISLQPLKLQGSFEFEASKLYTEWKYMRDRLKLEVADGKISLSGKYIFNLDDINATKIEDLHIVLNKLRIKPKNRDKDILNIDTMSIKNVTLYPMQQRVEIEKFALDGLRLRAKRYKNGQIDLIEYLKEDAPSKPETKLVSKKDKTQKKWSVLLHSLGLEKIAVTFEDQAIKPNVTTKVNKLDIYADNITLLGKEPIAYTIDMLLNSEVKCQAKGKLVHNKLNLKTSLECKDFDIVHYRPYIRKAAKENLKRYDLLLEKGMIDFDADANILEINNKYITKIQSADLKLKKFRLRKRSTNERLLRFNNLQINKINVNTATKDINISKVALNKLGINITRKKNGKLNVDGVVLTKVSRKIKKHVQRSSKREKPYHIKVKELALNNAAITFTDKKLAKIQRDTLKRIYIKVNNIDSKKNTWLNYRASLRVNKKGILKAKGSLRHTPLKQRGTLRADEISLVALTPYLQEYSYLSIDDGLLSFSLKEQYRPSKNAPDVKIDGSLKLNSLFTSNQNDNNSSLFSLNELEVKPFTLELFPNRLYIDKVLVDSFYVSAKIDENKTFNFAKLTKKTQQKKNVTVHSATSQKEALFPVTIVKVNVENGSAEFQDFSLPIKFKTDIHDLQGVVYAVSNTPGSTTYLDIDGEVDKYGSTKLKGSVDSFNPKEYTDLNFNFKNLSLPAMSGYTASFAGYEIAAGKLYLDLGYNIMYGKLQASNNILIKHIKLGREIEGKNIKHLPLGFVIGLLEDSNGIIDIDMPIEGNVNKPDFKYGALVWKTLGNLIAKAVSSPFKFLGAAMGLNGNELEYIAFEFGKSHITPPEREKLDKIAKMMMKRPKLVLEVDGTYDEVYDLEALKLRKLVVVIMRKSGEENIKNAKTALTVTMLEDVYSEVKGDDALEKIKEKLQKNYKGAVLQRAYQKELIKLCTQIQKVSSFELKNLAKERAQRVQAYLVNEKFLSQKRVKIGKSIAVHASDDKEVKLKLNIEVKSTDK